MTDQYALWLAICFSAASVMVSICTAVAVYVLDDQVRHNRSGRPQ